MANFKSHKRRPFDNVKREFDQDFVRLECGSIESFED